MRKLVLMASGAAAVLLLAGAFLSGGRVSPTTASAASEVEKSGCCSWHGGVCGCSGGRALCCDGVLSPTCGC
jgi:hypothetical protein